MERINRILHHPDFNLYLNKIMEAEKDRIFCGHGLVHLLDVCRLAWILYLEEGGGRAETLVPIEAEGKIASWEKPVQSAHKEWIYAAGLLHDIGRWRQYEDGTDHAQVSKELAPAILADCGFNQAEIGIIAEAIGNHRNKEMEAKKSLSGYLYRADKKSRPCFGCRAEGACDWSREKKNLKLLL